jgi:type I restriction-modification system DNA methylase subunit
METKHLKKYAPEARRDFIAAVKNKAAVYGLLPKEILPMQEEGDVVIIGDRPFPRSVAKQRKELEDRVKRDGFDPFIESIAYTWFNRFVAIRYMELHGYLDHGYRVLSHPEGKATPEILENAERVELPGLKRDEVVDLKLDGGKDERLYQMLLLAQCNALHKAMPFLFESIKDGTELLLPDNLLHTDSLVRTLVNDIPEEQWENVEIIGWLYQFYISERKDEVIGKVVASEDIPAATQLFTPNWIVRYMLHNTLGRKWLATYPDSPLRNQMEYYIEPAEQTSEVQEQLRPITPTSLNPEELTLLDPACGSGHILMEAYDLFKSIYAERGYRPRDIPQLILTKNLFGLEIDDRAAQLAAFALMMKARADDRRIFDSEAKPSVVAIQDSEGMKAGEIYFALTSPLKGELEGEPEPNAPVGHLFEPDDNLFTRAEAAKVAASRTPTTVHFSQADIASLIELFENGKTFGSLIQISPKLAAKLPEIDERLDDVLRFGDLTHASAHVLKPLLQQARLLDRQHDIVIANPPYMGSKFMTPILKDLVKSLCASARSDTFAAFMDRCVSMAGRNGYIGMVTPFVWMFISSYQTLRERITSATSVQSLIQLEYNAFEPACVPVCTFVLKKTLQSEMRGVYIKLSQFRGAENQAPRTLEAVKNSACGWRYTAKTSDFSKIPGTLFAYWFPDEIFDAFGSGIPLSEIADPRQGLATTNNGRFVRQWWEVSFHRIGFGIKSKQDAISSGLRWFPYNKGGDFRRWFGNGGPIVNWENDGAEIKAEIIRKYPYLNGNPDFVAKNQECYFRESGSWSKISNIDFVLRYYPPGFIFDVAGCSLFTADSRTLLFLLGLLNSNLSGPFITQIAPTMNFEVGQVASVPIARTWRNHIEVVANVVSQCIDISREDWNTSETSWDFARSILYQNKQSVEAELNNWGLQCLTRIERLTNLEEENNRHLIAAYGLKEMSSEVDEKQIVLCRPDREEDIKRLLSYAIGCMMGRYSLDKPGLIYAHSGNQGFDASQYQTFPADDDGIVPITDMPWFSDDAANRFEQFVKTAWPEEHLEENLKFVAESLDQKKGETPRECIRRYLATGFYKHHLPTYKKRPIYWLFSSGKQRAFQCLVYLHRYNASTLSRMRTEYVVKLQGKINARIDQLEGDIPAASSSSQRKQLEKERDTLIKQREELQDFDEKLRHYADQQIELDLDDGVKVNYGKFGDLLAGMKAITGGKSED